MPGGSPAVVQFGKRGFPVNLSKMKYGRTVVKNGSAACTDSYCHSACFVCRCDGRDRISQLEKDTNDRGIFDGRKGYRPLGFGVCLRYVLFFSCYFCGLRRKTWLEYWPGQYMDRYRKRRFGLSFGLAAIGKTDKAYDAYAEIKNDAGIF